MCVRILKLKENGLLSKECFKPVSYSSFDVHRRECMGQIISCLLFKHNDVLSVCPNTKTKGNGLLSTEWFKPVSVVYVCICVCVYVLSVLPRDVLSGSLRTSAY